jgi:hypothetical protein
MFLQISETSVSNSNLGNNIYYFLIYLLISFFFIGLGSIFSQYFISKKMTPIEINVLPIIGIFIFGNVLVIANFFINLNNFYFLIFLIITGSYCVIKSFTHLQYFKIYYFNLLILFISSFNIGISKDANLYHLQQQAWLRDEKIVFGLSNINPFLGYSSVMEYINSIFWIDRNFVIIHFISLYILASVFGLVFKLLFSDSPRDNNIAYIFLIIGILDNFGLQGGRNGFLFIQEVFKYDHIFSYLICFSILLFWHNSENKDLNVYLTIFYVLVFALQVRFVGHLFLFIFLIMINPFKLKFEKIIPGILIYVIFSIKNILVTSCLWFPVSFTCISNLPWSQANQAEYITKLLVNSNRYPNAKALDVITFKQFSESFISNEANYLINFLLTTLCLVVVFSFSRKKIKIRFNQLIVFILIMGIWMYLGPKYRFAVPFFLLSYFVILDKYVALESFPNTKNYIKILTYSFVIVFTLTLESITTILEPQQIKIQVEPKEVNFIQLENDWFQYSNEHTVNNYLCGINKYCYIKEYDSKIKPIFLNYKYFQPKDELYYSKLLETNK